jgi:hypothetical protein
MTDRPPSAYQTEQAISVWQSIRARLMQDDLLEDETELTRLLGPVEAEIDDILARLLRGAVHAKSMAEAAGERIDDIKARQTRYKAREEAMRSTAYAILEVTGRKRVELPDLTASIRNGTQSAMIVDEAAIPDIYVEEVIVRKIDKQTVLSVLKSGGEVPGAFLSNGLSSLSIRRK